MYDPEKHRRHSIRLKGYDYSQPGSYYVTICAFDGHYLFGDISHGRMILNKYGNIARQEWLRTEKIRKNVRLDAFVVMPNHLHGIIVITSVNNGRGVLQYAPATAFQSPSNNLGAIICGYKSAVTKQINELNDQNGDKVWQRNYYDHIIRNRQDLNRVRKYIRDNPKNWKEDKLN